MHQTSFIRLPEIVLAVDEKADYFSRVADIINMFASGSQVKFKKIGKYFEGDLALFFRDFDVGAQHYFLAIRNLILFDDAVERGAPLVGQKFDFTPFEVVKMDHTDCDDFPEVKNFETYVLVLNGLDGERTAWGSIMLHKPLDNVVFACLDVSAELPYLSTNELSNVDHYCIEQASSRKFEYIVQSASDWLISTYEVVKISRSARFWETFEQIEGEKNPDPDV